MILRVSRIFSLRLGAFAGNEFDLFSPAKAQRNYESQASRWLLIADTQGWRWKNVDRKNDREDALKLAQLSAMAGLLNR